MNEEEEDVDKTTTKKIEDLMHLSLVNQMVTLKSRYGIAPVCCINTAVLALFIPFGVLYRLAEAVFFGVFVFDRDLSLSILAIHSRCSFLFDDKN